MKQMFTGGRAVLASLLVGIGGVATATASETPQMLAGDAARGQALSATCVACHGPNMAGVVAMKAPSLVGQHGWYLKTSLKKYKSGARGYDPTDVPSTTMKGMSATLVDEQAIDDVVAYLTSLKPVAVEKTLEGDPAAGQAKFALCVACHGDKAQGNEQLKAPRLAGQNDWYIVDQLKSFKKGSRGKHETDIEGMQMVPFATMLSDQDMVNVAAYITTLPGPGEE